MTLISHWFAQRRRRFGRALLLGLALAWSTMVAAPCIAAASTCLYADGKMGYCPYSTQGGEPALISMDCTPLMQLDCQTAQDTSLASSVVAAYSLPPIAPVILGIMPVVAVSTNADSAYRHTLAAAAVPRPPLNLQHARLQI